MPGSEPSPWVTVFSALMTGGVLKYVYDVYSDWRKRPPKVLAGMTVVDASIATIARARDELEEDNARLRLTLAEERRQFNEERARYLADINRLEAQIRQERDEFAVSAAQAAARYDALLEQVRHLKYRPHPNGES